MLRQAILSLQAPVVVACFIQVMAAILVIIAAVAALEVVAQVAEAPALVVVILTY